MYQTTPYKYTKETRKLEHELLTSMRRMPLKNGKRICTLYRDKFDVFLQAIPQEQWEYYKQNGIPLAGNYEFIIKCDYYAKNVR